MLDELKRGTETLRGVLMLIWNEATAFVRIRLVLSLVMIIATTITAALGPVMLKLIVDRFTERPANAFVPVGLLIGAYVMTQWLSRGVSELRTLLYARAEMRMFRTLSERVFEHVMHLPLRFHLDRQTGAINQSLENGLSGFQLILHHLVFTFLPVVAELGTIFIVLLTIDQPGFLALFCVAAVCYAVAFSMAAIRVAKPAEVASAAHVDASAIMTDSILNYDTVKYFAAESLVQQRVSTALRRSEMEWFGFYKRYVTYGLGIATIFGVFMLSSLLYATPKVLAGTMSVGTFIMINTYMLRIVSPIETLGYAMQGLSQGVAMLKKLMDLLQEVREPEQTLEGTWHEGPGRLEFRDVCLAYSEDLPVLKRLSFTVPAGTTLGIVGTSGAGKSTIVRLLVRLLEPNDGVILLDGASISEVPVAQLRKAIAVVPQDTVLFNDSIAYNIGFGKAGSSMHEVQEAAKIAHLHDFIMTLPEQYETRVGERGVKLSGGERQRVSIARAVLKNPQIYVFDEATSSLDSRTEAEILRNLSEVSRLSTTVVIAHRLSTVVNADMIVVLDNGAVVERGTHEALLRHSGKYAALWHAQQSRASKLDSTMSVACEDA